MPPRPESTGRLEAVSVGLPREIRWRGETIHTGIVKAPVQGAVRAEPLGLAGDGQADLAAHGGVDKAIYAYDESSTCHWRDALARPELTAGSFGENLTLSGFPENEIRIGDHFRIGSARFEVSQPRQPCGKLGMLFDDPGLPKRFFRSGRVGYYLRVIETGEIEAGDQVLREATEGEASIDIQTLVALWLDRKATASALAFAVENDALADAWRVPLRKRLEAHPEATTHSRDLP